ncbi:unnamed protein product [Ectocarpus sp. 12 AP-2014]
MARVYPCVFLIPVFNAIHIRGLVRHSIVFALALIPAPGIKAMFDLEDMTLILSLGIVAKELLLGCVIGVFLAMPFWMFESVGTLLDNQRGALLGGQINPSYGPSDTLLGNFFRDITIMFLIAILGFPWLIQLVWDSYVLWPPTAWFPAPAEGGFGVFTSAIGNVFMTMMLYAAPFIAVLLLVEFSMAVMNLFSPKLDVFLLSIPAKSVIGLAFLVLYFPTLIYLMSGQLEILADIVSVFDLLFKSPE